MKLLQKFGHYDNDHCLCQSVSHTFAGTKPEPEEAVGCVVLFGSEAFRAELVRVWPVRRVIVERMWINAHNCLEFQTKCILENLVMI